jgi:CheY-like chemotaxis protein
MDSFDSNSHPDPAQLSRIEPGIQSAATDSGLDSVVAAPEQSVRSANDAKQERRRKRRAVISAPVRVRGVDITRVVPDEVSTTVDVSRTGVLVLTSSHDFHRGMEVAVTFPYTKTADLAQAEKLGRVVRVSATSDGKASVAIAFGVAFPEPLACKQEKAESDGVPKSISAAADPKRPLVLLVESEDSTRTSTKAFLCGLGYEVIGVANASDAREVLNMFTPVLLIAEIEGEGLPGFDLCAHVKATPRLRHIPVMLTTRSAYPSDYSSAHSLGAVVCMAKPYRLERLGHVVGLLAPTPAARDRKEPPRPADPTRRLRRPGHQRSHPRLRFG